MLPESYRKVALVTRDGQTAWFGVRTARIKAPNGIHHYVACAEDLRETQGEIEALNFILDRTVYLHDEDGGTMIIPGHGRVTYEWEVAEYRDMVVIVRDRVQALIKTGATLQQVLAARPTADYDVRYGATTGPWTTDMFVEAVYTSLKNPPKAGTVR